MAVVGSAAIRQGYPKGEFSLTGRKYTVQWLVNVNSYNDGPIVAQSASGLPAADDTYSINGEADTLARLRSWNAYRLDDNSLQWVVEATYSTPESKEGGGVGSTGSRGQGAGTHQDTTGAYSNPLIELPLLKTFQVSREVPVERVWNVQAQRFNPPMNAACEVFNPPAMKKETYLGISISRNEPLTNPHPALGVAYSNAVNSDWFWGLPPGNVQCQTITAERQTKQVQGGSTVAYLRCEYVFHCRQEGWDLRILNAGNYYCDISVGSGSGASGTGSGCGPCPDGMPDLNNGEWCLQQSGSGSGQYIANPNCSGSGSGSPRSCPQCTTNNKRAFRDREGHPIKGLLNWNGGRLAADADPVYMTLRVYNWRPFTPLGLPQSFSGVM